MPVGIASTVSNPFSDSHEAPSLAGVNFDNLNQVEMSIFESETERGQFMESAVVSVMSLTKSPEAAFVVGLRDRDGSTQEVAATIPFAVGSDSGDSRVDSSRTGKTLSLDKLFCG